MSRFARSALALSLTAAAGSLAAGCQSTPPTSGGSYAVSSCSDSGACGQDAYADLSLINGRPACVCVAKKADGAACTSNEPLPNPSSRISAPARSSGFSGAIQSRNCSWL